jgi:tetratricopeptide (TPR) repeat protein
MVLVCLFSVPSVGAQGDKAIALRRNVVRVLGAEVGFGFIVAQSTDKLFVVTAEHVVFGENNPNPQPPTVQVVFYSDPGTRAPSEIIGHDHYHDLALLRVSAPAGFTWEKQCLAPEGEEKRTTPIWFVGRGSDWYVPALHGAISSEGRSANSWLEAAMPELRIGSSGAPIVASDGIIGMVSSGSADGVHVLSIDFIKQQVGDWHYPWDLDVSRDESRPAPPPGDLANAQKHYEDGKTLGGKNRWKDAIREYREAIRLNPGYAEAHVALGFGLLVEEDWDGAIAEEKKAIRLKPGNAEAHFVLGSVFKARGDWDGAIFEEKEAVRLDPDMPTAHYFLAGSLSAKGDLAGAIIEAKEAVRLMPNNSDAHFFLGGLLENAFRLQEALSEYSAASKLNPNDSTYQLARDRLAQKLGQR